MKLYKNGVGKRCDAGFTLIEIMLAIFIFAIVVTTILTSFNMVLSSGPAIKVAATSYTMAAGCFFRITEDVKSVYITPAEAYAAPDMDDLPDPYRIQGVAVAGDSGFSSLRFTSLSHLPMGKDKRMGIAEIIYYLQEDEHGQYLIRRSDKLYPYKPFEASPNDPVLCENVKSFRLTYYDLEGELSENWDSDDERFKYGTPVMIGIKLELNVGDADANQSQLFETKVALPVFRKKKE